MAERRDPDPSKATTWRLLLQQPDLVERIVKLPIETQRALGGLVEAALDLADEAYAIRWTGDIDPELGRRVQTSSGTAGGRTVINRQFARHLTHRLPYKLDDLRTHIRKMLCFDQAEGYRGPYERRAAR